jgi:hypothetical protein
MKNLKKIKNKNKFFFISEKLTWNDLNLKNWNKINLNKNIILIFFY